MCVLLCLWAWRVKPSGPLALWVRAIRSEWIKLASHEMSLFDFWSQWLSCLGLPGVKGWRQFYSRWATVEMASPLEPQRALMHCRFPLMLTINMNGLGGCGYYRIEIFFWTCFWMFIERNTDSWGTLSTKRFKCMEYLYLSLFEPCFNIAIKEISDINEIVHLSFFRFKYCQINVSC